MSKRNLFFRAEASSKVGLGHLMRCMALASMLDDYYNCIFLLNDSPDSVYKVLKENNYLFKNVTSSTLQEEMNRISCFIKQGDIFIIDGYQFDEKYFESIKRLGLFLVLIDDLLKDSKYADVIINHAVDISIENYYKYSHVQYCLGEKFIMLRPPFMKLAKQQRHIEKVKNVFICFGGADHHNLTLTTLKAAEKVNGEMSFHVVLASTFPYQESIRNFNEHSQLNLNVYNDLAGDSMAKLMNECDVAIAPTSGLSYEVCAVGMGFLGGYYINNQRAIHDGFLKRDCLMSLQDMSLISEKELGRQLQLLVNDLDKINQMISNQRKVINGGSKENFIALFSNISQTK